MSKHTDGAWERSGWKRSSCEIRSKVAVIATVYTWEKPAGEGEANAALIASAPDLLAACKSIVACGHYDTCGAVVSDAERYPCSCPYMLAEAAIAKARGEEPAR